jgi:hypothetical protein
MGQSSSSGVVCSGAAHTLTPGYTANAMTSSKITQIHSFYTLDNQQE